MRDVNGGEAQLKRVGQIAGWTRQEAHGDQGRICRRAVPDHK